MRPTNRHARGGCVATAAVLLLAAAAAAADNVTRETPPAPTPRHAYAGSTADDIRNPDKVFETDEPAELPKTDLPGAGAVLEMLVWVGVVVVFIYAAVYLIRRYVPSARNMFGSGVLKVVGRTYVSSKQCILLVKVGPKYVMVGVTGTSMTPLAEIAEPADAAKISEELIEKSGGSIAGSFRDELRRADDDYDPSTSAATVVTGPSTSPGAGGTDAEIRDIRGELEQVTKKMKWWRRQGPG